MAIRYEGLEGISSRFKHITDTSTLEAALNKAVLLVERQAKINAQAAVDTDGLAGTITSTVEGLEGIVYTPFEIAPYIEYGTGIFAEHPNKPGRQDVPWVYVKNSGQETRSQKSYTEAEAKKAVAILRSKGLEAYMTSGMKPRPFMRPALDDNTERIKEILGEVLLDD